MPHNQQTKEIAEMIKPKCLNVWIVGNGATSQIASGSWINRHTGEFLSKVAGSGHSVTYCELSHSDPAESFLQSFNLDESAVDFFGVSSGSFVARATRMIRFMTKVRKADFVYIFFPGTLGRYVAKICGLMKIPYGLYVRGEEFDGEGRDSAIFKNARFALMVSTSLQQKLIGYGCDSHLIRPMTEITEDRFYVREFGDSPPQQWSFFYAGRLEERKGTYDLIEIARRLKELGISFQWRLAGNGPAENKIREMITEYALEDQVQLLGFMNEVGMLEHQYREADAFIFPSHDEGFPRVLLEAMSNMTPTFTTMVGGIPGIAKDGENCFAIPVDSGGGAADVIAEKLSDWDRLQHIANCGFETARSVLLNRETHDRVLLEHLANLS